MRKVVSAHAPFPIPDASRPREWRICVSGKDSWVMLIPGEHKTKEAARVAYLKWASRRRLPAGSVIEEAA